VMPMEETFHWMVAQAQTRYECFTVLTSSPGTKPRDKREAVMDDSFS